MAKPKQNHFRPKPQTDTVAARYSNPRDRFVRDWDEIAGEDQRSGRVKKRLDMGQKMTPKGPKGGNLHR